MPEWQQRTAVKLSMLDEQREEKNLHRQTTTKVKWLSMSQPDFLELKYLAKSKYFSLHIGSNTDGTFKTGFRVAKKHIKKAVTRNLCKRLLKEHCRQNSISHQMVVLNTRKKIDSDVKTMIDDLNQLLIKLHNH